MADKKVNSAKGGKKKIEIPADEFKDQYIKLERIQAYIRKTAGKIKTYEEQLQKLRDQILKKQAEILIGLGTEDKDKLKKTI